MKNCRFGIFFYDSKCGTCNNFVEFLKRKIPFGEIGFLCLHSSSAKNIIFRKTGREPDLTTSYFLYENFLYDKSDAIFKSLGLCRGKALNKAVGFFVYLNTFILIHKFFNFCYDFTAKRRNKCKVSFTE
jgi:predicted DCC family thiol-disulfide oxidoreductase YuxK